VFLAKMHNSIILKEVGLFTNWPNFLFRVAEKLVQDMERLGQVKVKRSVPVHRVVPEPGIVMAD